MRMKSIEGIHKLTQLKILRISTIGNNSGNNRLAGSDLAPLVHLAATLEKLNVSNNPIGDEGLKYVAQLINLRRLRLSKSYPNSDRNGIECQ